MRRILREGAWVAFGQAATAAGLLVGMRLLTEFVSPRVFGTVSLLMGVLALGRTVFCVSILQAAWRFYADVARSAGIGKLRAVVVPLLWRTTIGTAIAILVGGGLYSAANGESFLAFVVLVALLAVDVARSYETNFLIAARRQSEAALLDASEALGRPLLAIAAVLALGAAPVTVLTGYALATACVFAAARWALEREGVRDGAGEEADPEERNRLAHDVLRYALPLMPMAVVVWISSLSDRFIIGGFMGREQVGLYAAAYGLMSAPFLMVHFFFDRTLTPAYFAAVSEGNEAAERRTFNAFLAGTLVLCGSGVLLVLLLHGWIAASLLAVPYRASAPLMPWLALGSALLATEGVFAKRLSAHKRTGDILIVRAIGATASLAATVPLVHAQGLRGAAIACPVYYAVQLAVAIQRASRVPRGAVLPSGGPEPGKSRV